jgi:small basic protein (TIGR04137 family)
MSLDRSLKAKDTLMRHRNVLSRAERVEKLKDDGMWTEESTVIAMPKVAHRKVSVGKKEKKEKTADEAVDTKDAKTGAKK